MNPKNVTILVYLHNNSTTIDACLKSIIETIEESMCEIIVIDDGSTDDSLEMLSGFDNIKIASHEFWGITKSINEQLHFIDDNDVVRINADVVIKSPDWLEKFQSAAYRNKEIGIVGARLLLPDNRIETDGRNFVNGFGYNERQLNLNVFKGNEDCKPQISETDSVSSAFCYYKNETIKSVGGFDENYFPFYTEDDDFCVSARRNNFSVFCNSNVQAYHFTTIKSPTDMQINSSGENFEELFYAGQNQIQEEHFKYWEKKWGWKINHPDLPFIRYNYGNTKICWNIGDKLRFKPNDEFPSVDICVVTWNNISLLKRMMESLALTDYPKDKIKIYFADNGSKDGTVEYLLHLEKNFIFELHSELLPTNSGVTYALNLAVEKGTGDFVARLDDDIVLPTNWLKDLLKVFLKRPYCGVVGPKILNDTKVKTIQTSDFQVYPTPFSHDNEIDLGQADYVSRTIHVKGCCNLYRRDVFKNCGLFDIRYSPTQYDDPDHHIAVIGRGYEIIYNGHVSITHKTNSGVNNSYAGLTNMQANQFKMAGKWGEKILPNLDKAIEFSFEKRKINLDKETVFPKINNELADTYMFSDLFTIKAENIFNAKVLKSDSYNKIVKLLLDNAVKLYTSNSPTNALVPLHTALNIQPSNILLMLCLYLAYTKIGLFEKAAHFKKLADTLNESNVKKLIRQNENGDDKLSDSIAQFGKILEVHKPETILEKFIIEKQFPQAELAFTIFSLQPA